MPTYRALYTDFPWGDFELEQSILEEVDCEIFAPPAKDAATLARHAGGIDALITCWAPVTAQVIDAALPTCRIIARTGIGLDNIDVPHATRRGLLVTNVPDYCVTEVAEHTLALLLSLARKLHVYHDQHRAGGYGLHAGLPLERLAGQCVGMVGVGRIGSVVARWLVALGCDVVAHNRSQTVPAGTTWLPLDELLATSDFVVLLCPLSAETRHLICDRTLALMKPTAMLVNTSRGGLVDHAALDRALQAGRLAGAALDVQDPEPPDVRQPPYNDPRVIVTPHVAYASTQAVTELRTRVARQVVARLRGERPECMVNPEVY